MIPRTSQIPHGFSQSSYKETQVLQSIQCSHWICSIFFLSKSSDNRLVAYKVIGDQISPHEAYYKIQDRALTSPLFTECQNYSELPKTGKGLLCAFTIPYSPSTWQFGILNSILSEFQVVHIFVWSGDICYHGNHNNNNNKELIYLSFFFESWVQFCDLNCDGKPRWTNHFIQKSFDMDDFQDF